MLAPFLQKIGVTPRIGNNGRDGLRSELHPFLACGLDDRQFGLRACQWPDLQKIKEPFRIRLRFASPSDQLRESSAYDGYGQLALRTAVQGRDERGQLRFFYILKFVDENDNGGLGLLCSFANLLKQGSKIPFQVAIVG